MAHDDQQMRRHALAENTMNHWLFKTEAETFSWEQQKKKGAKG